MDMMNVNMDDMNAMENVKMQESVSQRLSYGVKYTQAALVVDVSGSTLRQMPDSGKTISKLCREACERFLTELCGKLGSRLIVSIYTFGGSGVCCLVRNMLLSDIDIAGLGMSFPEPDGLTPMGSAICTAISDMEAYRREKMDACYRFNQPILSVMTDGRATDDMTEAIEMVDERLGHRPKQHLVFIPVGIGEKEDFGHLERMLEKDPFGDELHILGSEDDFSSYVRLIGATTIAVSSGAAFAGLSGLANNASIFTGEKH